VCVRALRAALSDVSERKRTRISVLFYAELYKGTSTLSPFSYKIFGKLDIIPRRVFRRPVALLLRSRARKDIANIFVTAPTMPSVVIGK
jgi:hypothetical protein